MSFEQHKKEEFEEKRQKKKLDHERNEFFWEKKDLFRQTHSLTMKLAQEISQEFWIDLQQAKDLLSSRENEISQTMQEMQWDINTEKLKSKIESSKQKIEQLSNYELKELKSQLEETSFRPESYHYHLSQLIVSESLSHRIKDPRNLWDQLLWAAIWTMNSTEAIILFLYGLWKGIILTPYHIYLLLTGKAKW